MKVLCKIIVGECLTRQSFFYLQRETESICFMNDEDVSADFKKKVEELCMDLKPKEKKIMLYGN